MDAVSRTWLCGKFRLNLDLPMIMAIINMTPDSFSGDGLSGSVGAALRQAEKALRDGAGILDVGGESTRPGAEAVGEQEELDRVIPVLEALVALDVPVSVDTLKPAVMRAAIAAGVAIVNDINALRAPGAVEAVAASSAGVCLMHMQGEPRSMQEAPAYTEVVDEVEAFLLQRLAVLEASGVVAARIALDPGFGFGKTLAHNLELFRSLPRLAAHGLPLLVGVSRKRMLGDITGRAVDQRMPAAITAAALAAQRGAAILRVHDVAATRDALAMWAAIDADRLSAY
ncbi:dihydropteroate synthase [Uliginosibacterium sp. TH139]|jgi:dihydropteroate synthase|uniref:dihydropteroate synthase n=1 Tax=Uliginosibacterium sp. TH139 TaxID=2067453 RepID=UPI000C7D888D|nr:dihydropteroate synthase [Uliginosibacterium sp. TH139]PLK48278.1 dihydropteroate synthase [Uliginosibacterium sp. TH139]